MRLARASCLATLLAVSLAAPSARADEPDAATTLSAVQLAEAAGELYAAGKYAEALDRYRRADALVQRHTIGVRIARCLAKLGRLTEAVEQFDHVARLALPENLDPDKLAKQREAKSQAESERDDLARRVPGVVVTVAGRSDVTVTIDGKALPPALYGVKRAIDPGAHHLEARAGTEVVTRDVTLKEGDVVPVPFELSGSASGAPPPSAPAIAAPPIATPPPMPPPETPDSARPRRIAGYVTVGVGAAGLLVGAIAGGSAVARHNALTDPSKCGPNLQCPPNFASDASTYNTLRPVTTAGLVIGGVLAATGVILIATAQAPRREAGAALVVGPAWIGLEARY